MARGPVEQAMEAAAHTYFERVTNADVDGILELYADDAKLINPMTGEGGIQGKAALRPFYEKLTSSLVDYKAAEGKTTDGKPIVMDNLNFWTFENGKFKVLRIYMDTHPYRQALSQALSGSE